MSKIAKAALALGFVVMAGGAQAQVVTTLNNIQTSATVNVPAVLNGTQTSLVANYTTVAGPTGGYVDVILPNNYAIGSVATYCSAVRISVNGAPGFAPDTCFNEVSPPATAVAGLPPYPIPAKKIALRFPAGVTVNTNDTVTATLPAGYATPTTAGTQAIRMDLTNNNTGLQSASGTANVAAPAVSAVPTMSEWAMILFGAILAGAAALYVQRRQSAV